MTALTKPRQLRSDSVNAKIAVGLEKDVTIGWPVTAVRLQDAVAQQRAEVVFGEMVTARPAEGWSRSDLITLAEYARLTAVVEKMTDDIINGAGVQLNQFGFQSPTPLVGMMNQMNMRRTAIWSGLKLGEASFLMATMAGKMANKSAATALAKASGATKGLLA